MSPGGQDVLLAIAITAAICYAARCQASGGIFLTGIVAVLLT